MDPENDVDSRIAHRRFTAVFAAYQQEELRLSLTIDFALFAFLFRSTHDFPQLTTILIIQQCA